jgi:phosphotransferase system  glucose/maltose/N-acetylglucosamine-specific IIC component
MIVYNVGIFAKVNPLFCVYGIQIILFKAIKANNINKIGIETILKIIIVIITIILLGKLKSRILKFFKIDLSKGADIFFPKSQNQNNFIQKFFSIFSGIFFPLIPLFLTRSAFVGIAQLKNSLEFLKIYGEIIFYFLPVYIGITAAKELRMSLWLGSWLGMFLIFHSKIYIGSVFPVLLTMLVLFIMKGNIILQVGTIIFFPSLGLKIGEMISLGIILIFNKMGILAGAILGAIYSPFVATGLHQGIVAIEMNLLQKFGYDFLLPIWAMADISQGGSALAVAIKKKNSVEKKFAFIAGLASIWGLSESAMFGINLKYVTPFIIACFSAAIGGIYVTFTSVVTTGIGLSGIPGIILVKNDKIVFFLLGCLISFSFSFILTFIFYTEVNRNN